jgi:SpoVK/Ycf46/Vps4 family AAA+-type ATPase
MLVCRCAALLLILPHNTLCMTDNTDRTAALFKPVTVAPTGAARATSAQDPTSAHRATLAPTPTLAPRRWNDLVLPDLTFRTLRQLIAAAREREIAADEWKSGRRAARPEGFGALFAGARGTGKSTAAELLALELGTPLMVVHVAELVSPYIGETEKNLSRTFAHAARTGALLFLDDADALFSKRTDVTDAHDRFRVNDISFFAKCIEANPGVTVLSVSSRSNLDSSFTRRLAYMVEFPLPGESDRRTLWSRALPQGCAFAADVDIAFLAANYPFTGGTIYAVVREAAALAAAESTLRAPVAMQHLLTAMVQFG